LEQSDALRDAPRHPPVSDRLALATDIAVDQSEEVEGVAQVEIVDPGLLLFILVFVRTVVLHDFLCPVRELRLSSVAALNCGQRPVQGKEVVIDAEILLRAHIGPDRLVA